MDERKKDWVRVSAGRHGNEVVFATDKGICGTYGFRYHSRVSVRSLMRLFELLERNGWKISPMVDGWSARPPYPWELSRREA